MHLDPTDDKEHEKHVFWGVHAPGDKGVKDFTERVCWRVAKEHKHTSCIIRYIPPLALLSSIINA